jgi:hypothetical protein
MRATCAVLCSLILLGAADAAASERPRQVLVLAGPGEAERTAELRQALTAHLIDSGFEPRVVTLERAPACPPAPDDDSAERHLSDRVVSVVWLSDTGDRFCMLTPEIDDRVRQREIPDSGEGWAARSEVAAAMLYSEVEPLVRRGAGEPEDRSRSDRAGWLAMALRIGFDVPTSDLDPFLVAALEVDVFPPVIDRRLALALDVSFTRPGLSGRGSDPRIGGEYSYEVEVLQLKAALDVILRLGSDRLAPIPFLGLGAICHYLRTEQTTSITPAENTEWSFEPGFEVLAGLDVPLGPGFVVFDFRFVYSDLDHLLTGDSNAGNVTTAAGYRLFF